MRADSVIFVFIPGRLERSWRARLHGRQCPMKLCYDNFLLMAQRFHRLIISMNVLCNRINIVNHYHHYTPNNFTAPKTKSEVFFRIPVNNEHINHISNLNTAWCKQQIALITNRGVYRDTDYDAFDHTRHAGALVCVV